MEELKQNNNCKHLLNFVSRGKEKLPDVFLALKKIMPQCSICGSVLSPEELKVCLLQTYEQQTVDSIHKAFSAYYDAQSIFAMLSKKGVNIKVF